jgi:hypothetical protein
MVKPLPIFSNLPLVVLVAANLVPIAGVLWWGWSVFEIVALYWFENVVIGAVNILKLAAASGEEPDHANLPKNLRKVATMGIVRHGAKLFIIPFFTFHYTACSASSTASSFSSCSAGTTGDS